MFVRFAAAGGVPWTLFSSIPRPGIDAPESLFGLALGGRPGRSVNTKPIGWALRYLHKFGSSETGTDRFLKKFGTEEIRYR